MAAASDACRRRLSVRLSVPLCLPVRQLMSPAVVRALCVFDNASAELTHFLMLWRTLVFLYQLSNSTLRPPSPMLVYPARLRCYTETTYIGSLLLGRIVVLHT